MKATKFDKTVYYATCEAHPWWAIVSDSEEFRDRRLKDHNEDFHYKEDSDK